MLKRKISYLILLYGVLVFNTLYAYYQAFIIGLLLIVLPVISILILLLQKKYVNIMPDIATDRVQRLDKYEANIIINNPTPFPITCGRLKICHSGEGEKVLEFGAGAFSKTVLGCWCTEKHCMESMLYVDEIYLYDYFKLIKLKITSKGVARVMVLPCLFDIEEMIFSVGKNTEKESLEVSWQKGDDRTEIYGIREYKDGDTERNIHWKLSSSKNKLMVKEFGGSEDKLPQFSIALLKIADEKSRCINDVMLEYMYSFIYYLLKNDIIVTGVTCNEKEGGYNKHYIDSKSALDMFVCEILASHDSSAPYSALNMSVRKEQITGSIYHFAADLSPDDIEAIISGRKVSDANIYIPDIYGEKVAAYTDMGLAVSLVEMKGVQTVAE